MKKVFELEGQSIDSSRVSHVYSWLVPLPTLLPIRDEETFTFWDSDIAAGGPRTVVRFLSAEGKTDDYFQSGMLMELMATHLGIQSNQDERSLDALVEDISSRDITVAELSAFIDLRDTQDDEMQTLIQDSLDLALKYVRDIQHAVFMNDKVPRPLLTTQALPSMIPISTYIVDDEDSAEEMGVYLIPSVISAQAHWYTPQSVSNAEDPGLIESGSIYEALDRHVELGPFTRYSELINEAQVAALNAGIPRAAALTAASAGEVLLDEVLRCVLWEKRYTPEQAGELFAKERDFRPRITNNLPKYLGGTWKLKGEGVVARWFNEVYQLRHRIVHAGLSPSDREVQDAIFTTLELNSFVADRLASKVVDFPRSAVFLLGLPGLQKRRKWSSHLDNLSQSKNEPHWNSTFAHWRKSQETYQQAVKFNKRLDGNFERSVIVFWVHTSGAYKWVIYDPEAYAAAEIDADKVIGVDESDRNLTIEYINSAKCGELEAPILRTFKNASIPASSKVEWKLPYNHLPIVNVMVDRTDQPTSDDEM